MENLIQHMHHYNCDECYRQQERGWGRSREKKGVQGGPSEEVMVKMRRNREEAVEGDNLSSLSLDWPKDRWISLISLVGPGSFISKYLFGIWLMGNADGWRGVGREKGSEDVGGEREKPSV